jgi:hypothetical protein
MFVIKENFKLLFTFFLCVATGVLLFDIPVTQGGPYLDSAHGNSSYGVDRTSTYNIYTKGHCGHCHEQHASIGGEEPAPVGGSASKFCLLANNFDTDATVGPYVQSDNACFYCHYGAGTHQNPAFSNYSYSITFGGNSDIAPATIFDAFNSTSYHNLKDVRDFATGKWPSTFTIGSNPCSGCHNVHIAKRNKANQGDPTYTAISKPSDHSNLWGDDNPGERMTAPGYGVYYQPPYYSSPNLEPDGVSSDRALQAGKTPDYVTFCQDCHSSSMTAYSLPNTPIDWETPGTGEGGGDKHGKKVATQDGTGGYVNLNEPYASVWNSTNGLVLACTDCHEPHGAPNVMLIRREVNGAALGATISTFSTTDWSSLCARCHDCDTCTKLEDIHHDNTGAPYYNYTQCSHCHGSGGSCGKTPINCNYCHFHGGDDYDWVTSKGRTPSNRRTF